MLRSDSQVPEPGPSATGREDARERLLAATQHGYPSGQRAAHDRRVVVDPQPIEGDSACAIARRASLRLATRPVPTSAFTTGVPRQLGVRSGSHLFWIWGRFEEC